ncbi:MAG TPA: hypothetical protein VH877_10910 [Polyangia bacterium]|nr:hypothetical protein [Polyangia bacterium]
MADDAYEAERAYLGGNDDRAIERARAALTANPDSLKAMHFLAAALYRKGRHGDAVAVLQRARESIDRARAAATGEEARARCEEQLFALGSELFEAAGEDGAAATATFLTERVGFEHPRALKVIAVLRTNAGDAKGALPLLERAIQLRPGYASAWYNLACVRALLGRREDMLEALTRAITLGRADYADYAGAASRDPDFTAFRQDPGFLALVDRLPRDPRLRTLYKAFEQGRYEEVLERGEQLLPNAADALAVLECMQAAVEFIVGDFQEHGDDNAALYDKPLSHYLERQSQIAARIDRLTEEGHKSDVWRRFAD